MVHPQNKGRRMKHIKCFSLMLIVFLLAIGCSGNYANIKNLSESESKAIQQELLDNWSDYIVYINKNIHQRDCVVFDPKNDDRKILVGPAWDTIQDQETWTEFVEASITSGGDFSAARDDYKYPTTIIVGIGGYENNLK